MNDLDKLIGLMAKLPGLGPKSARRAVLDLMKHRETLLQPMAEAMVDAGKRIKTCEICGNLDLSAQCAICLDSERQSDCLCVVEDVSDLWAMERTRAFRGRYHVLGGHLSALDGISPDDLSIAPLTQRVLSGGIDEVILALGATVEGQTTAHYIADRLVTTGVKVSRLSMGVPVGGEVNFLDEGTLATALRARAELRP